MANFKEALEYLKQGHKIRRICWEDKHYWFLENKQLVNSIGENPKINIHQIEAQDWEIYNEEKCADYIKEKIKYILENCAGHASFVKELCRLLKTIEAKDESS